MIGDIWLLIFSLKKTSGFDGSGRQVGPLVALASARTNVRQPSVRIWIFRVAATGWVSGWDRVVVPT